MLIGYGRLTRIQPGSRYFRTLADRSSSGAGPIGLTEICQGCPSEQFLVRVEKPEISGSSTDRFSCGVFAVLVTPCDHRGPMGLVGEASPDKWGSLHKEMTSQVGRGWLVPHGAGIGLTSRPREWVGGNLDPKWSGLSLGTGPGVPRGRSW